MKVINLCPRAIKVQRWPDSGDDSVMVFKSDAGRYNLRLELGNEMGESTYMDNIVVTPIRVQLSAKIPDPQDGIIFIVPKDIASLYIASGRQDLLFPDYPDAYDLPPDKYPTYRGLYKFE